MASYERTGVPAPSTEIKFSLFPNIVNELEQRYKKGKAATPQTKEMYAHHLKTDRILRLRVAMKTGLSKEQVLAYFDYNRNPIPYEE